MALFEKIFGTKTDEIGNKDPKKKAEILYQKGLAAVKANRFREAIPILEEASKLNENSAPIHMLLALSYTRIAGDFENDEKTMYTWISKAADVYWKAIILHREYGGLDQKQLTTALEFVAAVDRIKMPQSNNLPEEQRKRIYLEYMSLKESKFDLSSVSRDIMQGKNLKDMHDSLQHYSKNAENNSIERVTKSFGINERQIRAIIQEGQNKRW
jgi:tetratricopeptide (TPR) repeat protein